MAREASVEIENSEKVLVGIKVFIKDTNSAAGSILYEGARIMWKEAIRLAPESKNGRRGEFHHPLGTLKKSITLGSIFHGKAGISSAIGIELDNFKGGYSGKNQFYARFQEFGASGHMTKSGKMTRPVPAEAYMRSASKRKRRTVNDYVRKKLKEALFNG